MRDRSGALHLHSPLRWHAGHGPLHHRRHRRTHDPRASKARCRMTYIVKPKMRHPGLPTNKLGFTHRDYEGSISTLCAGCGHDSISAALIQACFEMNIEPYKVAKMSGI